MEFGIVGRTTEGFFKYQAWPTVARGEDGTLYAASSGHRLGHVCPFGKNYLYISTDEGKTWRGPQIINDTYMDDRDAGLCAWGDGNLLLSWFTATMNGYDKREPRTPTLSTPMAKAVRDTWRTIPADEVGEGSFIRLSLDRGMTWGEKIRVPVTAPHGPIRRADGSLLYLGKVFLYDKEDYEPNAVCAVESRDGGQTWLRLGYVPVPEGIPLSRIHEPHVVELPNGRLLGGIRISGESDRTGNTVYTTFSDDGGKTWSMPQPTGASGTPPHFLLHSSGAVVMTHGRRADTNFEIAMISYDGGQSWSDEIIISPESPDWDLGYPSSVELSDGSILTVYYQKYGDDTYNSILYTKWQLPDRKEVN